MVDSRFLHQHPEFSQVIGAVSRQNSIAAQLVEKDYWLMHVLWAVQNCGLQYELKGGTSLSKGWGIISRFSEDIDIKIFPPKDLKVYYGKNHLKPKHRESRNAYFEWLLEELKIAGSTYIQRDTNFDDHDLRNAGFRIGYKSLYPAFAGVKTDVLLEIGFDTTTPNEPHDISSWAYDLAGSSGLDIIDNRAKNVLCYLPEYTFVEKLSAISKKYRQDVSGKVVPNFTRHYYDIYQLLQQERVVKFIGTPEYQAHKLARFEKADEMVLAKNPAFTLPDLMVREKYAERLERSSGLYFRGQPTMEEILELITEHLEEM
jgi:hypothetical protein